VDVGDVTAVSRFEYMADVLFRSRGDGLFRPPENLRNTTYRGDPGKGIQGSETVQPQSDASGVPRKGLFKLIVDSDSTVSDDRYSLDPNSIMC
jgi:hypothetical protein